MSCVELQYFNNNIFFKTDTCQLLISFLLCEVWFIIKNFKFHNLSSFILLLLEVFFVSRNLVSSMFAFFFFVVWFCIFWLFFEFELHIFNILHSFLSFYYISSIFIYQIYCRISCLCFQKTFVGSQFLITFYQYFCYVIWSSSLLVFDSSFVVKLLLGWRNVILITKSLAWTISSSLSNRKCPRLLNIS